MEIIRSPETLQAPLRDAYIGGAGTPGRFLLSFATFAEGDTLVNGNERLCQRPMEDILTAMRKMGVAFRCLKSVKECDRIHATCHELTKLGVKVKEGKD